MPLDGFDILDAYSSNFITFDLGEKSHNSTTWTSRILNYFDKLGRMLGYDVEFEAKRFDLTWWDYSKYEDQGKMFFHLEHENVSENEHIIKETFEKKLFNSEATITMAICYPKNVQDQQSLIEWCKENYENFPAKEVVIFLDLFPKPIGIRINSKRFSRSRFKVDTLEKKVTNTNVYYIEWKDDQ